MKKTKQSVINARAIIADFQGNKDEFYMLKGLLCMTHKLEYAQTKKVYKVIDTVTIAQRMDDINRGL